MLNRIKWKVKRVDYHLLWCLPIRYHMLGGMLFLHGTKGRSDLEFRALIRIAQIEEPALVPVFGDVVENRAVGYGEPLWPERTQSALVQPDGFNRFDQFEFRHGIRIAGSCTGRGPEEVPRPAPPPVLEVNLVGCRR